MHELLTDIEIAGRPEQVWAILTDFATYPRWNPFIRHVEGAAEEGRLLEVCIHPPGARHENFRPKVLVADAPRELRWRTRLLVPGVFEGEHRFLLEPLPNGHVRFEQREQFRGLLTPLMRDRIDRSLCRGFREMNAALKGRVERGGT
ncbi:MAG: SRPBCC domain-containing protein [Burkholderiales bacterium]